MAQIAYPAHVDTRLVAKRIKAWLDAKRFDTKAFGGHGVYTVKARKSGAFRAAIGADRALEIGVRHSGPETQVEIRQGSWKTNAVSNTVWYVATGGTNLLISGWSVVIQKDLENFVRTLLAELGGMQGVDLSIDPDSPAAESLASLGVPVSQPSLGPRVGSAKTPQTPRDSPSIALAVSSPLLWNALSWIACVLTGGAGFMDLKDGLWKGFSILALAAALLAPPVRRCLASKIGIPIRGGTAAVYGVACLAFIAWGTHLADDQRKAKEQLAQDVHQFEVRRVAERKRADAEDSFLREKAAVLASAQASLDRGDYVAAGTALAPYAQVADPDLAKLRNAVAVVKLRVQLNESPSDERQGAIYAELARLDPTNTVAVAKAGEFRARKEQEAREAEDLRRAATVGQTGSGGPNRCFGQGENIAIVYLANLKTAVEVGMLASEMMNRGCDQSVGSQGQECVKQCQAGFRLKAKQWVKDGSL